MSFERVNWNTFGRTGSLGVIFAAQCLGNRERDGGLLGHHHDGARILDTLSLRAHLVELPRDLVCVCTTSTGGGAARVGRVIIKIILILFILFVFPFELILSEIVKFLIIPTSLRFVV